MILVRMVQALQMITCNKLKHLLFVYAVKVYFLFFGLLPDFMEQEIGI